MLVAYPEGCLYRRTMLALLQQDGRMCDVVYTTGSLSGLAAALTAGARSMRGPSLAGDGPACHCSPAESTRRVTQERSHDEHAWI